MRIPLFSSALTGLAGLLLVSTGTLAQNDDPDPLAVPTRYEVELIIFRHLDQSGNTAEIPAAASMVQDSPFDLNLTELPFQPEAVGGGHAAAEPQFWVTASDNQAADDIRDQRPPVRPEQAVDFILLSPRAGFPDFLPLDEGSFALNGAYNRMVRLDAYEPLIHLGWIQPVRNTEEAIPYRIVNQSGAPVSITGTVTLYKERYLHLELDLALEPTTDERVVMPAADVPPERVFGLSSAPADEPIEQTSAIHRLQQSRRVRVSNTHYFDHPLFGVIATVNKIETASGPQDARPDTG
jgi:hypothetical protein